MPDLTANINDLVDRMFKAAKNTQRNVDEVALVAASKTQSVDTIQAAYDCGLRRFGENYLSEAIEKIPRLPADIEWHYIGPIQSNKTRQIATNFDWVHTVDRAKVIQRLNEQRPDQLAPLKCLIQVNLAGEKQKAGVTENALNALAEQISASPRLRFVGLMIIPKANQGEAALRQDFAKMQQLLDELQTRFPSAKTLSMGMSQDFELAIEYGATFVRIGTQIFGERR